MLTVLTGAIDVIIAAGDADQFQGGEVRVGGGVEGGARRE